MSSYSVQSEQPCPECGKLTLYCEFDDGMPSASGDCVFVFTHRCACGYRKSASHLIGHDQEHRLDWHCDFCDRDWLSASSKIDRKKSPVTVREPEPEGLLYAPLAPNPLVESVPLWLPNVEQELLEYFSRHPHEMLDMPPRRFEELIAAVYRNNGFDVELTPEIKDGGLDIIAVRQDPLTGHMFYVVECKRWAHEHKVGVGIVRALHGVATDQGATKGIVATTSYYTRDARTFEQRNKTRLSLHDFDAVVEWLRRLDGAK